MNKLFEYRSQGGKSALFEVLRKRIGAFAYKKKNVFNGNKNTFATF